MASTNYRFGTVFDDTTTKYV